MDLNHLLNSSPEPTEELLVDVGPQILALHSLLLGTTSVLCAPQHVHDDLRRILGILQGISPATPHGPSVALHASPATPSPGPESSIYTHPLASSILSNVQITTKTTLSELYQYPMNTALEYPETSDSGVGHLFQLQPGTTWDNPTLSFAYSLGSPRGFSQPGQEVEIDLLGNGRKVPCRVKHSTCTTCIIYSKNIVFTRKFKAKVAKYVQNLMWSQCENLIHLLRVRCCKNASVWTEKLGWKALHPHATSSKKLLLLSQLFGNSDVRLP